MTKVLVDAVALREILVALNGPSHLIRELQALMSNGELSISALTGTVNPIDKITEEFNAAVQAMNEQGDPVEKAREALKKDNVSFWVSRDKDGDVDVSVDTDGVKHVGVDGSITRDQLAALLTYVDSK